MFGFLVSNASLVLADDIEIYLDNKPLDRHITVEIDNGVTFIPLRVVAENMGAKVEWLDNGVFVDREAQSIFLDFTNKQVVVNNMCSELPIKIKQNRLWVPLRFFAENLVSEVSYAPNRIDVKSYSLNEHKNTLDFGGNELLVLDLSVPAWDKRDYESAVSAVQKLTNDMFVLEVTHDLRNTVWEPQAYQHKYLSRYLLKGDQTVQRTISYVPGVANEFSPAQTRLFGSNLYLPGDNWLYKIDTINAKLCESYNLLDLLSSTLQYQDLQAAGLLDYDGAKDVYFVDIFDERYILLRFGNPAANRTSYPIVYDLFTQEAVWLHERLVPSTDIVNYQYKEITESAPNLLYKGESNGVLYFDYETMDGQKREVTYKYK